MNLEPLKAFIKAPANWQLAFVAALVGLVSILIAAYGAYVDSVDLITQSILIAATFASLVTVVALPSAFHQMRQGDLTEKNARLEGAINNMTQGLCLFDADDRLVLWNERYRKMYRIDPTRLWVGCGIRDLLDARISAGTFSLNPERYEAELRAALKQRKSFTNNIALSDGRTIAVCNQPIESGGWVATHEDITERVTSDQELNRTRSFLNTIISNVPTPIFVKSLPDFRYVLANKAAEKFIGIPAEGIIGNTAHEVFGSTAATSIESHDQELLEAGRETYYDEHSITTPKGESRIVTSTRLPIMGPDGKPQYLISVVHDITERKRDEARISYMAHHDPLTELPNRTAFNECLNATLDLSATSSEQFALLCLDLDRFKGVNDVFGHSTGDALLRLVGRRLDAACQGAFLARVGGDEFSVISPSGSQPGTAEQLAKRLGTAMAEDFEIEGHRLNIGVTVGIALYPGDGDSATAMVANADAALYRAKAEARGSIRFFEPDMDAQLRERRALQHDLRSAIANEQLELHYQPLAMIDGEVTGFEALARWHHPRKGAVPPGTFIPLAEESGLIIALGEWILRTGCREAASWPKPLSIAINLSPVQFQHGDLATLVHSILLETGLRPGRLKLEITEGVLMQDFSRAVSILRRLKNIGVRVAMDDFGTGYSSLSYLQAFSFDTIKIDQSFIANLEEKPQSAAIIRAVIGLAHGLGLPVVAEGVETEEQRAFLRSASCDEVQGYLIGRPKPIEAYAELTGRPAAKAAPVAAAG